MSSRLAFAPKRVKASRATSRMRSRLRWASARGFRRADCKVFLAITKKCATGDSLRSSTNTETFSILPKLACERQENNDDGTNEAGRHICSFWDLNPSPPNGLRLHA